MARRHDARQAGRGTRSHRPRPGAVQHLGAADPQPHRHAGDRHQESGRHQGLRAGPGAHRRADGANQPSRQGRARRVLGARRAADGWALHRRRHRPQGGGPLRACRRGRAGVRPYGHRRREHRRDDRRTASAFRSTCAFRANPRFARSVCAICRSSPSAARRSALSVTWPGSMVDGPPMLRSENARLSGWVYVDLRGRDLRSAVTEMQARGRRDSTRWPPGYSISWSGQFEYLERATQRLKIVVPITLAIIFILLYLTFRSASEALLLMVAVPFALARRLLVHLGAGARHLGGDGGRLHRTGRRCRRIRRGDAGLPQERVAAPLAAGEPADAATLHAAIQEGAVLRVRPKAMTVAVIFAGLLPIMFGTERGPRSCSGSPRRWSAG